MLQARELLEALQPVRRTHGDVGLFPISGTLYEIGTILGEEGEEKSCQQTTVPIPHSHVTLGE